VEELINGLVEKVGIDREKAEQVVAFLKEHASEVPGWLQSDAAQQVLGGLSEKFGGLFGNR
jgi:hypothetical protein